MTCAQAREKYCNKTLAKANTDEAKRGFFRKTYSDECAHAPLSCEKIIGQYSLERWWRPQHSPSYCTTSSVNTIYVLSAPRPVLFVITSSLNDSDVLSTPRPNYHYEYFER